LPDWPFVKRVWPWGLAVAHLRNRASCSGGIGGLRLTEEVIKAVGRWPGVDERCRRSAPASGGRSYRHKPGRVPARSSAGPVRSAAIRGGAAAEKRSRATMLATSRAVPRTIAFSEPIREPVSRSGAAPADCPRHRSGAKELAPRGSAKYCCGLRPKSPELDIVAVPVAARV